MSTSDVSDRVELVPTFHDSAFEMACGRYELDLARGMMWAVPPLMQTLLRRRP